MTTPYEAVPYDDRPVAETHVDHLHAAARLAGLPAAPPATARVLELGCAHAINLLPQAVALPGAHFVGVDLSPGQIEVARRRVEALALRNVRVVCADLMELELGEERYDYVVAHGLFSWVPDAVRDRLLTLAHRALAPAGVLYLSYNAMPAWGLRGAVRRALLELVGDAEDAHERVRRARAGLAALRGVRPLEGTPEGALLSAELEGLRDKPDAYLLHEYLVPFSRAYWLREIVALAEGAGLSYLDDVAPPSVSSVAMDEARTRLREALGARAADTLAVEQLLDVVSFRQFRASLWCRREAPRAVPTADAWLAGSWLSAEPSARPGEDASIEALRSRWPSDVAYDELASRAPARDELAARLCSAWRRGDVTVRTRRSGVAGEISERPCVWPLTRLEASELSFVTTPRHAYAPLDPFHAALIRQLDGSRTTSDVVAGLAADVRAGRLRAGGATAEQVIAALPRLVPAGLGLLHRAGLLVS